MTRPHSLGGLSLPAAAALLALSIPALGLAGPVVLDPGGLPVCAAAGEQLNPCVVPAADGAAIVVWLDRRRGASLSDVYALSVAANGSVTPGWPADGRVLCASGAAGRPLAVPDGSGGALVFWADQRPGAPPYDWQLYAQRVNADGTLADGWPADGRVLTTGGPFDTVSEVLDVYPDGSGGAYVARKQHGDFGNTSRGHVSRITKDGTYASGWNEFGVVVQGSSTYDQALSGRFVEDPGSGVIFALHWSSGLTFDEYVLHGTVVRITSGGTAMWRRALPSHQNGWGIGHGIQGIAIAADGSGGCFSSWLDIYAAPPVGEAVHNEFAQHYSGTNTPTWAADTPSPAYLGAEPDGEGGYFLMGSEYGVTRLDVYRRQSDGGIPPGWTAAGITLSTPTTLGKVASGEFADDLFLCWSDVRPGGDSDIRAVGVDAAGFVESGWEPDGTIISGATGSQALPAFNHMSPSRLLIAWEDTRTGTRDIRATRLEMQTVGVEPGIVSPSGLAIREVHPNPARARTRIAYSLPADGGASIRLFDLAGRELRRISEHASRAGSREVELDLGGLPAGIYLLSLQHAGATVARRIAILN